MDETKQKILIVDDSEMNRSLLADMLGDEFEIIEACDGIEAVSNIRRYGVDLSLVLLDIVMPRMDGLEVLAMMNSYKWIENIPVIMISSERASAYIARAYELQATDYIQRPFDATVVRRRVMNAIMLYNRQKKLAGLVEEQIFKKKKEQSLMFNILSYVIEYRNGESNTHLMHVSTITDILLQNLLKLTDKYKLSQQEIALISGAAALHDIGKIAIDEKILNKPGKLTPEEFEIIKTHSAYGAEILSSIPSYDKEPLIRMAGDICRWHHERYDGGGYPDGLKGDDIPIGAQVAGLADVYDTLTNKKSIPHDKAIDMIVKGESGVFNPLLIKTLKWVANKIQIDVHVNASIGNTRKEVARMARNEISHGELTVSKRTMELLDRERERYRFVVSMSNDIFFELYRDPTIITFSEEGAKKLGVELSVKDPANDVKIISSFGKNNIVMLLELIESATHENPLVSYECEIKIGGVLRRCRITVMTQYLHEEGSDEYEYYSTVGRIEELKEEPQI